MKTIGKQMLSLLLAVVLVLQLIPATVFAEQENAANPAVEAEDIQTDNYSEYTQEELASAQILFEEESLREEDVKHFRLDNGSYIAVQYGTAVHYQDNDGKWVDYDNTLRSIRSMDGSGVSAYRVENGDSVRIFAADANAEALLVVAKDDYSMSLTPVREADAEIPMNPDLPVVNVALPTTEESAPATILDVVSSGQEEVEDSLLSQAQPDKLYSALEYENIFDGADLRYENYGNTIKESIVIASPQAEYVYVFQMETEGLTPSLQEDGSVILSAEDGTVIYSIPAPYMIDANNEYSYDAAYTLTENNGSYTLTVTADADWMNAEERAFPVLLDPTVTEEDLGDDIVSATYINSGNQDGPITTADGVYAGDNGDASNKMIHSLLHINETIAVPPGSEIIRADFSLYQHSYERQSGGSTKLDIGLYPMYSVNGSTSYTQDTEDWQDLMDDITWNGVYGDNAHYKLPSTPVMADVRTVSSSTAGKYVTWDITFLVKLWKEQPELNLGFMLKPVLTDSQVKSRAGFHGPEHTSYLPKMSVIYRNTVGVESQYTYQTAGIGRAGTAYIADATLNNTIVVPLISSTSEVMQFSLSLVYNSVYGNKKFNSSETELAAAANTVQIHTEQFPTMNLGSGWKLSAQETVVSVKIGSTTYLIYTDADGTEHYFHYVGYLNGDKLYRDEDGLGLQITVDGTNFTMTDDYGNGKFFGNGYLKQEYDAYENYIYYNYNGDKQLTSIKRQNKGVNADDAETLVFFAYHETNNRLLSVTDEAGRTIKFSYTSLNTNSCLTQIEFPGNAKMQYSYVLCDDGHYRLATAYDDEIDYGMEFDYRENGTVSFFEEYVCSPTKIYGAKFSAEKLAPNQTRYQYYGDDGIAYDSLLSPDSTDDIFSYKVLDISGRTINSFSTDYSGKRVLGVDLASYTTNSGTSKKNNRLTASASAGLQGVNLLENASIENGNYSVIHTFGWKDDETTATSLGDQAYLGELSLQIEGSANANSLRYWYQEVSLTAGSSYTFSGYVHVPDTVSFAENGGVYLAIQDSNGVNLETSEKVNYSTQATGSGWIRLSVTLKDLTDSRAARVAFCGSGFSGSVYADALQLEVEDTASTFNLVEDGSFEHTGSISEGENENYWYKTGTAVPSTESGTYFGSKAIKLEGNLTDSGNFQRISRKVKVNAPLSSTFILSAWAKADAAPSSVRAKTSDSDTYFGLVLRFHYSDGTQSDAQYYPFDPYYRDWQYMQGIAVPDKTGDNITIDYITIVVAYDNNINTAYIDNVAFRMEPVQTYSYDENGNLKVATQTDSGSSSAIYSGVDLTKYVSPNGNTATYTYNDEHDLTKAVSAGVTANYTYNTAGNLTKTTLTGGSLTMESSTTYAADGNSASSVTDATGNTTNYTVDDKYGLLMRTTDANGNITSYAYVAYDSRPLKVAQRNSANTKLAEIVYDYSNGRVSSLRRDSDLTGTAKHQTYNFGYNLWGQSTSINVGNIPLAAYEYENIGGANNGGGNMTKMTYGNDDSVNYFYDEFDRLIKMVYNDTGKYVEYAYNAEGALAEMYYKNSSDTVISAYAFEYDSLGRLIRSAERDSSGLVQRTEHMYDSVGRLSSQSWILGSSNYYETYSYNDGENANGSLSKMTTATGDSLHYTYDALHRLQKVTTKNANGTALFSTAYAFKANGTKTTPLVEFRNVRKPDGTLIDGYKYTYDAVGNILGIYESELVGNNTEYRQLAAYEYDLQNQLVRETLYTYEEDNETTTPTSTTVYAYTYDTAGNILTESKNGTVTKDYTYSTGDWKDILTDFGEGKIAYEGQTYNAIANTVSGTVSSGNPISYYNGTRWDMDWQHGRQLGTAISSTLDMDTILGYAYDADGIRTSKTYTVDTYYLPQHTVTFVADGVVVDSITVLDGYALQDSDYPPVPIKFGYHCGWSKNPNPIHEDITISAIYKESVGGIVVPGPIVPDPVIPSPVSIETAAVTDREGQQLLSTSTVQHDYITQNGKVVRETVTTDGTITAVMDFIYDESGRPFALSYTNGTSTPDVYYYVLNLQGDVVGLVNSSGGWVAHYTYNAWGEILTATGTMADVNPLRYRGYYYDTETGFYYLQSRYYDPATHRFINADSYQSTGQGVVGTNMFVYCLNQPVMMVDIEGENAIYVSDRSSDGLFFVGHAYLYLQDDDDVWYKVHYIGSSKPNARVIIVKIEENNRHELDAMLNGQNFKEKDYIHIQGDFSNSLVAARELEGTDYGGYSLLTNNCLHFAKEMLLHGAFASFSVAMTVTFSLTIVPQRFAEEMKVATCAALGEPFYVFCK